MARRVRAYDWASTPLGSISGWPSRLTGVVDLVLAAELPMIVLWGPQLIQVYNDGYAEIMGGKHPAGLGQPTRECWPEVWSINAPIYERVLAGGAATFEDALFPITRSGVLQDAWFTLSYSPVRDEGGAIAGVLVTVIETTAGVLAKRERAAVEARQAFLLQLSDALRPLTDPIAVQTTAMRLLAERLDVMRATYFELEDDQDHFRLTARFERDAVPMPERMRLSDFSPALIEGYSAGRTLSVADTAIAGEFVEQPQAYLAIGVRAWAAVPLARDGRLVAWIGVHSATPREWTPADLQLLEDVAERTWGALEWARADARLRESEGRYRTLFETIDEGFCVAEIIRNDRDEPVDLRHLEVNPVFEQQTGLSDVTGKTHADLGLRTERHWFEKYAAVARTGEAIRFESYHEPTGRWYDVFVTRADAARDDRVALVFSDTTERRRAEAALRESEARHRLLIGSWTQAVWETDPAGVVVADSPSWRAYTGQTLEEWLGYGWLDAVHPDDRAHAEQQWRDATAARGLVNAEFRLRAPDGGWRWTNVRAAPVLDAAGNIEKWAGINLDIEVQKRSEATLRDSEERQAFLLKLSDAVRPLGGPADIQGETTRLLREELNAGWCYYVDWDLERNIGLVLRDSASEGLPSLAGAHDVSEAPEFLQLQADGTVLKVRDYASFEQLSTGIRQKFVALGFRSMMAAPLVKEGRLIASLLVGDTGIREWSASEASLLFEVAERTWAAIERARAEAALRESDLRLRTLSDTAPALIWFNGPDGNNQFINQEFLDYTGRTPEQIAGEGWHGLIHPEDEARYVGGYVTAVRERRAWQDRSRHRRADGVWHWFEAYARPLFAEDGRFLGHAGVSVDVDDVVQAEAVLRESEERQAFLFELSDDFRLQPDEAGIGRTCVDTLARHMGLDRCYITQMLEERNAGIVGPEYRSPSLPPISGEHSYERYPDGARRFRSGAPMISAHIAVDPTISDIDRESMSVGLGLQAILTAFLYEGEGRTIWALAVGNIEPRAWTDADQKLVQDVAERTWAAIERARAEAALRQSEERFRALTTAGTFSLYRMSPDWRRVYQLNSDTLAVTAEPIEDWVEKYIPPEDLPRVEAAIGEAIRTKSLFELEHRVRLADGNIGWIRSRAVPLLGANGEIVEWFGTGNDVTDRRRALESLRESEQRFRQFGEASSDVLWIVDAATMRVEYLSPAFDRMWGVPREIVIADLSRWAAMLHPDDRARALTALPRAIAGESVLQEYRIIRGDGAVRYITDVGFPVFDADGRVVRVGGIAQDLTERRQAEAAVRASERFSRALVEGVPQLVWRAVDGGHWTWASPQWTEFTGQAEADSHDHGWLDPVHPDDRAQVLGVWGDAIERGEFHADYRLFDIAAKRYCWFQSSATPLCDDDGTIVEWLGTSTDVDGLRQLQDRQKVLVAELQHRTFNLRELYT